MRTIKELTKLLNPRKKSGGWHYVAVSKRNGPPYSEVVRTALKSRGLPTKRDKVVGIHEIHFDTEGKILGITESQVTLNGETTKELIKWMNIVKRDLKKYPTLTWKEHQLIFNSK